MKKHQFLFLLALGLGLGTAFAGSNGKMGNNQIPQGTQKEESKKQTKYTFNVFKIISPTLNQHTDSTEVKKLKNPKTENTFKETTDLFNQNQKDRSFFKLSYAS